MITVYVRSVFLCVYNRVDFLGYPSYSALSFIHYQSII